LFNIQFIINLSEKIDKIKEISYYHTKIKDWPESERPREKLINLGVDKLSDAELLAIILRAGSGKITAVDLAKRLLIEYSGLIPLSCVSISELKKLKGIGNTKAVTLVASFEIGKRIASGGDIKKIKLTSPENVAEYFIPSMWNLKKEIFKIVLLDSNNQIIKDVQISEGSLNSSIVHPREVFKPAILESSASIILIHNHPSGSIEPSSDDIEITKKIIETGKIIGINVYDHIIIGGKKFTSLANMGLI